MNIKSKEVFVSLALVTSSLLIFGSTALYVENTKMTEKEVEYVVEGILIDRDNKDRNKDEAISEIARSFELVDRKKSELNQVLSNDVAIKESLFPEIMIDKKNNKIKNVFNGDVILEEEILTLNGENMKLTKIIYSKVPSYACEEIINVIAPEIFSLSVIDGNSEKLLFSYKDVMDKRYITKSDNKNYVSKEELAKICEKEENSLIFTNI